VPTKRNAVIRVSLGPDALENEVIVVEEVPYGRSIEIGPGFKGWVGTAFTRPRHMDRRTGDIYFSIVDSDAKTVMDIEGQHSRCITKRDSRDMESKRFGRTLHFELVPQNK